MTLINKINRMVDKLQVYEVKNDDIIYFANLLEEELQTEFNNNNIIINIIGDFQIEISIANVSIAKINIDSDGETMWLYELL